jgi:uncharacterized protein (UPF0276 family)
MLVDERLDEMTELLDSYDTALKSYHMAVNHFENAEHEHIDVAIIQLQFCEKRLDALRKEIQNAKKELSAIVPISTTFISRLRNSPSISRAVKKIKGAVKCESKSTLKA